ncbi:metallophosphoesterase [Erythrobacter mangrovi]|uniref:Metallophosphoesterase n=1 Tax=Erythrobacter mangrovi TaxID=2739433 RepID=A0A7D4BPS4_9SPHN|nr:metallophosphoesterase [Erythrobacter mangrovi]QKG72244.1 metallophosphoesterase [Erythrobacter mangrovi]
MLLVSASAAADSGAQRIVAVGDLHGDYDAWLEIAQASGVSTDGKHWTGGRSMLVQLGDIVDRGPESLKIIRHLQALEKEAAKAGGKVVVLLGNHEAMNVIGDLRYVDPGEYAAFVTRKSERTRKIVWQAMARSLVEQARASDPEATPDSVRAAWMAQTPLGLIEHRRAWSPGGELGAWTADRPALFKAGDILFAHGGMSSEASAETIAAINARYAAALAKGAEVDRSVLDDQLGPIWYRGNVVGAPDQGLRPAPPDELAAALAGMGVSRLVVGHTPSLAGIAAERDGQLIRIDTGISKAYGGPASFLEIVGDETWAHERGLDGQWSRRALPGTPKSGERP